MVKYSVLVTFEADNGLDPAHYVAEAVELWGKSADPESSEYSVCNVFTNECLPATTARCLELFIVAGILQKEFTNRSLKWIADLASSRLGCRMTQGNIRQALVNLKVTLKDITNG